MLTTNDFRTLADVEPLARKCPRCSMCKFPPLVTVRSHAHSGICPAYDRHAFHANSGGGLVVLAMSLLDARCEISPELLRTIYGCTACGGCDVSCKYNSDIEVQEIVYLLRQHAFASAGPLPGHARMLTVLSEQGHPVVDADAAPEAWLEATTPRPRRRARYLLWIGPYLRLRQRLWKQLRAGLRLLEHFRIPYQILDAEPYCGRAALEVGDRKRFEACAATCAERIAASEAQEILCLDAEAYATFRNLFPRITPLQKPVRHWLELVASRPRRLRSAPRHSRRRVVWHDAPYLGRLSEPWHPWRGTERKRYGQMIVTEPPRPVGRGTRGLYEPPRRILRALRGVELVEFERRREYTYDAGACGQAHLVDPELTAAAARERLTEARDVGADLIVTECPTSYERLADAAEQDATSPQVRSLAEFVADRLFGEGGW